MDLFACDPTDQRMEEQKKKKSTYTRIYALLRDSYHVAELLK